jgi:Mg2+ and Co2+ transporter CorA
MKLSNLKIGQSITTSMMDTVKDANKHMIEMQEKEVESLDKQIEYCHTQIKAVGNDPKDAWEKKEYLSVIKDCEDRRNKVLEHINRLEHSK